MGSDQFSQSGQILYRPIYQSMATFIRDPRAAHTFGRDSGPQLHNINSTALCESRQKKESVTDPSFCFLLCHNLFACDFSITRVTVTNGSCMSIQYGSCEHAHFIGFLL